jgi:hypothetical protein
VRTSECFANSTDGIYIETSRLHLEARCDDTKQLSSSFGIDAMFHRVTHMFVFKSIISPRAEPRWSITVGFYFLCDLAGRFLTIMVT